MSNERLDNWARHFDTLLWTVTAILLGANGALLVHCTGSGNFDLWLALGGLGLTLLTVYFAASFRELRQRVRLDEEVASVISGTRRLYQWNAFLLLFLALTFGWVGLIWDRDFSHRWVGVVAGAGVVVLTLILGLAFRGRRHQASASPRAPDIAPARNSSMAQGGQPPLTGNPDGPLRTDPALANGQALASMHTLFLEALRHREQEILQYLAILGPGLGGFIWLLYARDITREVFVTGTLGVELVLIVGMAYALTLGYNYRYLVLQLAKLETALGLAPVILSGWPREFGDLKTHYRFCGLPWCAPPEIIKCFWIAFIVALLGVAWAARLSPRSTGSEPILLGAAAIGGLISVLGPIWLGRKLHAQIEKELR